MFLQATCHRSVVTKICVCNLVIIFIFLAWNGIHTQIMSRCRCTANPKCAALSGSPYRARFSLPIDLVITWVNGSDPSFIEDIKRLDFSEHRDAAPNRFRDWGILRYCLRSVEKFANWIRHVYIVTNGQVPIWLNTHNPRVSIVTHSDIFPNKSHLPTFSSTAIESHIHRIPELSQQFLYMNDDLFFANTVKPEDFFTENTGFKVRFQRMSKIPDCAEKCTLSDINNGVCDKECNISKCDWDGEDCNIYGTESRPRTGLKRFGSYHGSLIYVVFLYNKKFGYVHRKVLAHVPNIIDKTVMDELYNRFPREWEKTSASKVRDPYNFQYPFAYYHYLLRPRLQEQGETRRLPIATTYQSNEDLAYFETGNPTSLNDSLQSFLKNKNKKFGCVNDVMNHKNVAAVKLCQVVIDTFFKQLLPERSSFELVGK